MQIRCGNLQKGSYLVYVEAGNMTDQEFTITSYGAGKTFFSETKQGENPQYLIKEAMKSKCMKWYQKVQDTFQECELLMEQSQPIMRIFYSTDHIFIQNLTSDCIFEYESKDDEPGFEMPKLIKENQSEFVMTDSMDENQT